MKNNSKSKKDQKQESILLRRLPRDYPWKVLGWLAEDLSQYLSVTEQEKIDRIIRLRDFDGLLALPEEWGLQSMSSTVGTRLERAARYQLASLLKKFRFATNREARVEAAIIKFIAGEAKCADFNREGYRQLSVAAESWMVNVFTYARSFMEKLLGYEVPSLDVMTDRSRHGPGATLDTKCGLISSYFKYSKWPYQCTKAVRGMARQYIEADERWLGALEDDYRTRFNIPKHAILDRQRFWLDVFEVVDGNRIAFVPKDARVERSIAIEPTMNLFLQLGVDGYIRRRLKRWGVDLDDQTKNQRLAFLGSCNMVDPYVTIDLANASNTISLKLCELLLPEEWYNLLMRLRSPQGTLADETIKYEMISSMGNGFTFALESALFTSIIYGVARETKGVVDPKEWAVFGDDLIVRQSLSERLITALTNCGFEINVSKSYLTGFVRESCGTDWFRGHPVRPVFLEDTPKEVDELFCDVNRLKRILEVRWGVEESKSESGLTRWIPEKYRDIKGPYSDEDFDSYIHVASPQVPYRRCMYKYKRLVRQPVGVKGCNSLLFRKLMHDLRPLPPRNHWEKSPYTGGKLTGCGGRFSVYRRGAFTLSQNYSVSSYWRSEYTEYRPVPNPHILPGVSPISIW